MKRARYKVPLTRYLDAKASDYEPKSQLGRNGWEVAEQRVAHELTGAEYSPEAILEMQHAILEALRAGADLPTEMRQDLIYAFEQLIVGIEPELLRAPRFPGKRVDPLEARLKAPAVRYLQWADSGLLVKAKPEGVVAAAYGVIAKTTRNWLRDLAVSDPPSTASKEELDEVQRFMFAAGKAYQAMKLRSARKMKRKRRKRKGN